MNKFTKESLTLLFKSILYRIWGTLTTIIISFLFTGNVKVSLGIGAVEVVSKIIIYYIFEKIWNYFSKNKNKKSE